MVRPFVMTASNSKGNGGRWGYYSCSKCDKSRFREEELERWFVQRLQELPSPVITRVVDPGDSSWNQLLAELSTLSKIVGQSTNDTGHESSSTAALEQRGR